MAELSQIQRIIKILEQFSMARKLSASELYDMFEGSVSLRTIQRDINAILNAGIPLISEKRLRREHAWSFPRDYRRMLPPVIKENEILSLYILKSYLKEFRNTAVASSLESVIDKLERMIPGDIFWDAGSSHEVIWDQNYGSFDYRDYDQLIEQFITAIQQKLWIQVEYKSINQIRSKSYVVYPHMLFSYHGTIYVAAYHKRYAKNISMVVQRVQSVKVLQSQYKRKPMFDREAFRRDRFGVFEGESVEVTLRIAADYADYFINRSWHPSQKTEVNENGDLLLTLQVPLSPELITWILGWHEAITVLAPDTLIEEIKHKLDQTRKLYE